ncbi:MAG: isoleucine--tRNA ligase [Deltaproteobacteria bacterium]|nr:isoleucine--tRNA ligase [Deltaproteobacteria bacterium]
MSESSQNEKPEYKKTLNLPLTDFPMKADLPNKEPGWVQKWAEQQIYSKILKKNENKPKFVLHDGPPYANGHIHHGHVLNKILKDFIIKYKNLSGYLSDYIPGWDCHGLPIEHQVDKDLGPKKKDLSKVQIRQHCREYAQKFVDIQKEEFRRLGILGRWDHPYRTMTFDYEAATLRELGRCIEQGLVYRGRKPVHWCTHCQTALAEAEVEYENHRSPSIYVPFQVKSDLSEISSALQNKKVSFVIWTTTPWTLAANVAIAIHKSYTYAALQVGDEVYIVAEGLLDAFKKNLEIQESKLLDRIPAKKLENLVAVHPFLERESKIIFSDHVTLEQGTGCVHIAPGHGQEDYEVGMKYGLPVLNPVDPQGKYSSEVGVTEWVGIHVFKANPQVCELLRSKQSLLKFEETDHSYPHCWRCKHPVIFRSTAQWFISMQEKDLRQRSLDAIRRTEWVPAWGRDRIYGMVENRPDWCISRQRSWGVPIAVFRCLDCHQDLLEAKVVYHIAELFETEGADAWFLRSPEELIPSDIKCSKCGARNFEKENDILDVWFDSGVSYAAVLEKNKTLSFPADLYLEGSDQHRGWFHSSLLASVGTRQAAPYKTVLTHGFVVDGQGRKYSKSAKNYVPAEQVIKKLGAEILRLWVAAEDYRNDIRFSDEIISRLTETYRKIRNTCRYLLGNLHDFDPQLHSLPYEQLPELDQWALNALVRLSERLKKSYESYEFHQIYHGLNHFCTVELSSFYLDILKDRLYTSAPTSAERRAAQTVLFELAKGIALWMAPLLSFTADEVWKYLPSFPEKTESIFLSELKSYPKSWMNDSLEETYQKIRQVREEVLKALEIARQAKVIGSSLEAQVKICAEGETLKLLKTYEKEWPTLLIVSQVVLVFEIDEPTHEAENLQVKVIKAEGNKCGRCWTYTLTVGRNVQHPDLCERCCKALVLP